LPGLFPFMNKSVSFLSAMLLFLCCGQGAMAHSRSAEGSHAGIPVPQISHGEMAVIAGYRQRIIALASVAIDTDEPFRRILNYAQIQYSYCLWGKMPGSVTDEESPFNECAHAYLAATKAVLFSMRDMPRETAAASAIFSEIDAEMVRKGMALITCRFSGEAFNTADIVKPRWREIPMHAIVHGAFCLCLRRFFQPAGADETPPLAVGACPAPLGNRGLAR
jgi:hypothetical protein